MRYFVNRTPDYIWTDVLYRVTEADEASYWCVDGWSEGVQRRVLETAGFVSLRPASLLEVVLLIPEGVQ